MSLADDVAWVLEVEPLPSVSGSSAACLANLSAISLPSIPWWLGHHRISIQIDTWFLSAKGGVVLSGHDCVFLAWAWIVGCHPPASPRKMVTVPSVRSLVAATRKALGIAAHSASYAFWPRPLGLVAFPGR